MSRKSSPRERPTGAETRPNAAPACAAGADSAAPVPQGPITRSDLEWWYNVLDGHARRVIVPRKLAEQRRRAGDPKASPRDYACGCPVDPDDLAPRCHEKRPVCRFRDRVVSGLRIGNNPVVHKMAKATVRELWRACAAPGGDRLIDRLLSDDERNLQRMEAELTARHAEKISPRK